MQSLSKKLKKESGGALSGIIVILLVLIIGGMYFYMNAKKSAELIKQNRERAASDSEGIILNANAGGSIR